MSRFDEDDPEVDDDRDVSPALTVGEGDIDASLRPRSLQEFIGQPRVREQLQLVIEGAKNRGGTPDHILLSGPPGLGKTTLAQIMASELGVNLVTTTGPVLERSGDLAAILTNLATPVGAAFVTHSIAGFGASAVAGQATIKRLTPVAFGLIYSLSGAVGPVLAQNLGAKRYDRVREGLRAGADDYLCKPFSFVELIARLEGLLRRQRQGAGPVAQLSVGDLHMDLLKRQVRRGGQLIELQPREFRLLEYLMRNSGRVLTRGQLIDRVWGADYVGDTKTLDVHVKRLRSKIESDPANPVHLVTVRGLGYKLEG